MQLTTLEMITEPGVIVAVVGATDNPEKFGYTVYRDLKKKGYKVFPVNPKRETVDGDKAYPNLQDLPITPDIANLVVPPEVSIDVAEECLRFGIQHLWLQPGAESPEVLEFLQENGLSYLAGACIMLKTRRAK
ncbi:MAG: CoA-binding protein [Candidatus Methylumidiphilus sp.]